MKCRKILPLNEKPSIRTGTHHAYPCAIIESKELAIITVSDFNATQWNEVTNDTSVQIDDNCIKILEKENGYNTNTVLWRECAKQDEIIIHMDYVKPQDSNRYIDVFLFNDDLEKEIEREDKSCGIRWNPFGYFIVKDMYCYDTKVYTYLKFCVEDDIIIGFASRDGVEWKLINQKKFPMSYVGKKLNVGIHMYIGRSYYYIWKNMNFIQMIYNATNPNKGIHLDYYFFPRKNQDNSYAYFLNFLETHYDLIYDAMDCFHSIHNYIQWNIQHFYYLAICLDEFYVVDRPDYNESHYNHYNLFYGFDDEKRVYYIMGYGASSKPIVSELSYDMLDQKIITDEKITRYKYSSNDVTTLKFNINPVITSLYEFLYSIDSSKKISNLMTEENVSYGISILKTLASSEIGKHQMQHDIRIAFFLLEHSKLMKERVNFLLENRCLENGEYECLVQLCDEIVHNAAVLLGLVLKNRIKPMHSDNITQKLIMLYNAEKEFCEKFLEILKEEFKGEFLVESPIGWAP